MLAPLLLGSGSSGTTTRPSSGTTSGPGSSTSSSTSQPPPSQTTQPSSQEPEAVAPDDIDDGTYQPATTEEPTPAPEEDTGNPEEVTAEAPPAQTETDAEPTPVAEEPAPAETEAQQAPEDAPVSDDAALAEEAAVAEDAAATAEEPAADAVDAEAPADEAEASTPATTPSPVANDRPVTTAPASERISEEDAIEAAALAEYRGPQVAAENEVSNFAQQLTTLIEQSLNRARERALEVSQARIIAGLLLGAETPEPSATSALTADAERQPVDVAEAIRAYRQA